jgi:hypothetical protein
MSDDSPNPWVQMSRRREKQRAPQLGYRGRPEQKALELPEPDPGPVQSLRQQDWIKQKRTGKR